MIRRICLASVMLCFTSLAACGGGVITPSHHVTEEYNAAFAAASSGDIAALRTDLSADPGLIRATEWEKRTLLIDAVDKGHLRTAEYLISQGANVDTAASDGRSALHFAAQHGDVPMMQMLLQHNANINSRDGQGWTPLDRAEKWGHPDAATWLRSHGGRK